MAAPVLGVNAALPINHAQPRFPPEVCERIIDHLDPLWPDRQPLLDCALVCRGWYAQSRAVLFEEPVLHNRKEALLCVASLKHIPVLDAHVRSLQIGPLTDGVAGPELASILVMLAGKFPKLDSLAFYHVSFEQCSLRNLALWSLHEFSHITSLVLCGVTLPSVGPFFQVICSFPLLQHLECTGLEWRKPRSMASLPERHRMPLTKVTSLLYDLSCFEGIGHLLLGLLDQAILKTLKLYSPVSAAALDFTQNMLNAAGGRLEVAKITFRAPEEDAGGNIQSLLLQPISFEANVNMQKLRLCIITSETKVVALFVRSMLLSLFNALSSKDLKDISVVIECDSKLETDALLNAFDQDACVQIDERFAEGYFAKLQDIDIVFYEDGISRPLDSPGDVQICSEICARFPKLIDKNMLIIYYNGYQFPSDTLRGR